MSVESVMSFPSPELLARHDGWLRSLIRSLVDDGLTDDVLQEVWGQAFQAPPADPQALPGWLATVARRVAGRMQRGRRRRDRREAEVARLERPEPVDPAELAARVEERQQVAAAVLDLDEPFRTVLLLRYFEDLEPAEIARRLEVPAATVRSRLHRAHQQLRQRFERERGAGWRGELALLCLPVGVGSNPATGLGAEGAEPERGLSRSDATTRSVGVGGPYAAAVAAVVLALSLAVVLWALVDVPAVPVLPERAGAVAPSEVAGVSETLPQRRSLADEDEVAEPAPASVFVAGTQRIAGRLVDPRAVSLGEHDLLFAPGEDFIDQARTVGRSRLDGSFDLQLPKDQSGILLVRGDLVTLYAWSIQPTEEGSEVTDAVVVAAPMVDVSGWIVDREGRPVTLGSVAAVVDTVPGFPEPLAGARQLFFQRHAQLDERGRFAFEGIPAFGLGKLSHPYGDVPIPVVSRDDVEMVVDAPSGRGRPDPAAPEPTTRSPRGLQVEGVVSDAEGRPIEGALVTNPDDSRVTETDAEGRYQLRCWHAFEEPLRIQAIASGSGPQQRELLVDLATDRCRVDLVLPRDGQVLSGSIVDEADEPVAGLVVALADPTPLDFGASFHRCVESIARHEWGAHGITGGSGEFRIPGVLPRPYRLRLLDPTTGYAQTFGPFEPGRPHRIRIPSTRQREALEVRVIDRQGRPVAGARVEAKIRVVRIGYGPRADRQGGMIRWLGEAREEVTDANGRCAFASAPGGDVLLEVSKPGWVTQEVDHAAGGPDQRTVTLLRQRPVRLAVPGLLQRGLSLELFDRSGMELENLPVWRGEHPPTRMVVEVVFGHTEVFAVSEAVHRAVLRDGDEVLGEMLVPPEPDGVTVLDFPGLERR